MQYTRILCLGDSITFGARAQWGETYPVLLERQLSTNRVPSVCLNRGVNGETSFQIVERGQAYLLGDPWLRVVVCLMGTNDSKPRCRTPLETYIDSWRRLLLHCRCTDTWLFPVEIPFIAPTGQPEYDAESINMIQRYNDLLRKFCEQEHLTFIDGLYDGFAEHPDELLADGIHPNNYGNRFIAELVHSVLGQPIPYIDTGSIDRDFDGPYDVAAAGSGRTSI